LLACIPLSGGGDLRIGGSGWKACLAMPGLRLLVARLEVCLTMSGLKAVGCQAGELSGSCRA